MGDMATLDGPSPDCPRPTRGNPLAEFARFCEELGVETGEEAAAALALWRSVFRHTTWMGALDGVYPLRGPL
ncbi:hypothetical protein FHU40_001040 [Nocardioides soli]|uniref:Uncharacterized protein n=1 Tax=Nocardioides soli TaxID=1036020 RepID=A0A7W4YZJ3_9ACTN|nr:hypothetical protein [Nocardioides soli]